MHVETELFKSLVEQGRDPLKLRMFLAWCAKNNNKQDEVFVNQMLAVWVKTERILARRAKSRFSGKGSV